MVSEWSSQCVPLFAGMGGNIEYGHSWLTSMPTIEFLLKIDNDSFTRERNISSIKHVIGDLFQQVFFSFSDWKAIESVARLEELRLRLVQLNPYLIWIIYKQVSVSGFSQGGKIDHLCQYLQFWINVSVVKPIKIGLWEETFVRVVIFLSFNDWFCLLQLVILMASIWQQFAWP